MPRRGVRARQTFDPDLVSLKNCRLKSTDVFKDEQSLVRAFHTWTNENPAPLQAIIEEVTVLVNGNPAPMQLVEETRFVQQVGPSTYWVVVGPGSDHTVSFDLLVEDLPVGTDLSFGVDYSSPAETAV